MPTYIIRLDREGYETRYMEWSTVTDTPTTYGLPLEEFQEYYGRHRPAELSERLARADGPRRCSAREFVGYDVATLMGMFRWEWFDGLKDRPHGISMEDLWHWYCDLREEPSAATTRTATILDRLVHQAIKMTAVARAITAQRRERYRRWNAEANAGKDGES